MVFPLDSLPNDLKLLPLLQAEKLSRCDRDIWSFTMRLFEREVQGRSFLVVLFLHYAAGHRTLGNSSRVTIDFVTSSADVIVPWSESSKHSSTPRYVDSINFNGGETADLIVHSAG
jgi:hypothetical protein